MGEEQLDFETIAYRVVDSVAHLTLSRPARTNALNGRMLEEQRLHNVLQVESRPSPFSVLARSSAAPSP